MKTSPAEIEVSKWKSDFYTLMADILYFNLRGKTFFLSPKTQQSTFLFLLNFYYLALGGDCVTDLYQTL